MMEKVILTLHSGGTVASVDIPIRVSAPPPELIVWGQRYFIRQHAGLYREALTEFVPVKGHG